MKPPRPPELGELRAFCTAADMGSIGRAAIRLGISQPALSKRIRSLEAIAGVELLERSPRGVTLNVAGRRLYAEARKLLEQAEVVEGLMGGLLPELPPVRLAVSHTIAEFLLPAVLVTFEAQIDEHSPHSLELTVGNSAMARRLVGGGGADLGIVAVDPGAPDDGLEERQLFEDRIVVAVPPEHRWARRKEVPLVEFLRTPMVMRDPEANSRRVVEAILAERNLSMAAPLAEVGNTFAVRRVAIERSAPALLSSLAVAEDERLTERPIAELELTRSFVTVSRGGASLPPAAKRLVKLLDSQLRRPARS